MLRVDEKCTGCRCCEQVCRYGAIKISKDKEGFLFPSIDADRCVGCGICEKKCPNNVFDIFNPEVSTGFSVVAKDINILTSSSSGGMFSIIARYVLSKNGIVFGAAFQDDFSLKHIYIDNEKDLKKLSGSKYFQSDIGNSYTVVKELLKKNVLVYYSGTPCQIAGLKSFLNREYDNLITSDLICHGVPSPLFFEKYKEYIEKKNNASLINFSFRKMNGWGVVEQYALRKGKKVIKKSYADYCSEYLHSFLMGGLFRKSCYSCLYSNMNRCGDITIGDFWGIQKFSKIDCRKGVSAVLLNNEKAKKIFEEIKENIIYEEHPISHIVENNPNLVKPSSYIKQRDVIYEYICKEGIPKAMKEFFGIKNFYLKVIKYKIVLLLEKVGIKDFIKRCIKK